MNGYNHADYAWSLQKFGAPRELHRCGGWVLERNTPGGVYKDAMGLYPFFVCEDWSKLAEDLESMREDAVCVSLVTDPFGDFNPSVLEDCFKDVFKPFKQHYIVDLNVPMEEIGGKRRRKHARKALKKLKWMSLKNPLHGLMTGWMSMMFSSKSMISKEFDPFLAMLSCSSSKYQEPL